MMMDSMKYSGVKEKSNDGVYIDELGPLDFVYTQPSVDEMNMQLNQTRSQRIRAAMFPESLEDYGYQHPQNGQSANGMRPTAVQKLSQPTNKLKTAIVHLINYQEDADVTIKAIPELIKLLNDEERPVVARALKLIEQLSRKDASRLALTSSQDLISSLIKLILNTHDGDLHHGASTILNNLCSGANKQALYLIFKSNGIPALIKLLGSPLESVLYYAITTLHNLLMYEPSAKAQVHHYNGTRKMVELLSAPHSNKNPKFLAMVLDCLHILAFNNSEVKLVIQTTGGPQEVVRIMRSFNYHKLTWTCVRLMKVLSVCPENKRVLVENGAMQALSNCLQSPQCSQDHRILYNCLLTLRNLSDCAIREENLEGLIKRLIELLNTNSDFNINTCAAGILSNLTCNNDMNKIKFVEFNGVETILKAMLQASPENKEDICEPAVCTLRHVTNRHPQAQTAQEQVRYFYGLPVISPLLEPETSRWPLLKATIGLIRNLALSDNNLAPLKELGIIARLVQLLIKAINAHQQAQAQGLEQAIVDDVAMEEIIEGAVGALHQLARDHHNGAVIRDLKCIPVLVQLLYMNWESIQRVACGCLSELANDRTNLELIDAERITDKLTDLLKSNDHAISTYAAAVLLRLSEFKPPTSSNGNGPSSVDASAIYSAANSRNMNNIGSNDQYVSYNTIDPYELEMHNPPHYGQMHQLVDVPPPVSAGTVPPLKPQHGQPQSPATWFDTDL